MQQMTPVNRKTGPLLAAGVGALVLAAVLGGAAFVLGGERAEAGGAGGEGVKIELVSAVERTPEPGEVMEVGEVADGFVYVKAALQPAAEPVEDYWVDEPSYADPLPPRPYREPVQAAVYPRVDPAADAPGPPDRAFGFDAPRRDYRAEREARRARLDALVERSSETSRPWAEQPASTPDALRRSDSTFY